MKITPIIYSSGIKNTQNIKENNTATPTVSANLSNEGKLPYPSSIAFKALIPNLNIYAKYKNGGKENIVDFLNLALNFEDNVPMSDYDYRQIAQSTGSLQAFVSDLYDITRYTTYSDGGMTTGEFVKLLKSIDLKSDEEIYNQAEKLNAQRKETILYAHGLRKEFFNELIAELSKQDQNSDFLEYGDEFMNDLANAFYEKQNEKFEKYNNEIKAKLEYKENSDIEKFNLEDEIKKLPEDMQAKIKENFGSDYKKMMELFIAEGCISSRAEIEYSQGVDTALIQMLPRYVQERKDETFGIAPLARRLQIADVDSFLEQFKEGNIYSYPKTQSCSKKYSGSEIWFSDSRNELNVVLRIHPKSKATKAFDIKDIDANRITGYEKYDDMEPRYYTSEVLYPPNTKFRVLGTSKYVKNNYSKYDRAVPDYCKTIVDLQEI